MRKVNVSIILMDTMRLDEFNKLEERYGYLGAMGFVFLNNCIAPSSWTLPSHASLFTGMYPSEHGSHETPKIKSLDIDNIRLKKPTFISELSSVGYSTYGISANPYVHPVYGFNEFDHFSEESYFTDIFGSVIEVSEKVKPRVAKYRNIYGNNIAKLSLNILMDDPNLFIEAVGSAAVLTPPAAFKKLKAKLIDGWPLEKGGRNTVNNIRRMELKEPFFLFVNLMEAHDPYVGKKELDFNWATPFLKKQPDKALVERWKGLYSKASFRAYKYAAQIVKDLIERYGDDQLFIVTSDHGQGFGEHGFIGHGVVLYDEVVKIPLAMYAKSPSLRRLHPKGFSSLANLRRFIIEFLNENERAFEKLSGRMAYAESFGVPANISMVNGIDKARLKSAERYQKRKFGAKR